MTDAEGLTTTYSYDALGRVIAETRRGFRGKSRCPYSPDYVFLCLGREGESNFEVELDEDEFDFVSGVKGMKTMWGLFRRKRELPPP